MTKATSIAHSARRLGSRHLATEPDVVQAESAIFYNRPLTGPE